MKTSVPQGRQSSQYSPHSQGWNSALGNIQPEINNLEEYIKTKVVIIYPSLSVKFQFSNEYIPNWIPCFDFYLLSIMKLFSMPN